MNYFGKKFFKISPYDYATMRNLLKKRYHPTNIFNGLQSAIPGYRWIFKFQISQRWLICVLMGTRIVSLLSRSTAPKEYKNTMIVPVIFSLHGLPKMILFFKC